MHRNSHDDLSDRDPEGGDHLDAARREAARPGQRGRTARDGDSAGRSSLPAIILALGLPAVGLFAVAQIAASPTPKSADLQLEAARVTLHPELDLLVFEQEVSGKALGTVPFAHGDFDGAPVLSYVFPTTLAPDAVGFTGAEGTLALVVTSHPDFDDTPLWDEDGDGNPDADGALYHAHWVVLTADARVPGGLAVKELSEGAAVPGTHPGLPLYLDSPGFPVIGQGDSFKVLVPSMRVGGMEEFNFDGVSAYLQVNTSDDERPVLGVYEVYEVLSGDLSLPFGVESK